jgi:NADH-quinone oxidoreductase subunit J
MNSTELLLGQAYFWICAALAVVGAISTVLAKNPIRGAMGLLMMILAIAGIYLALHAQFLAAIQLIVYAGAIVVLFIFVIMLLGPDATPPNDKRGQITRTISGVAFGAAGIAAMSLIVRTAPPVAKNHLLAAPPTDFGTVESFGRILFTDALVPFELSSALLMVAIIGAVAVARGHHKSDERGARPPVAGVPHQKLSQLGQAEQTEPVTAESTGAPALARVTEIESIESEAST